MSGPSERQPPAGQRFTAGNKRSRGRPKGARNYKTIVNEIARERIRVKENGTTRFVSTVELLLKALARAAVTGDVQADRYIEGLRDRLTPEAVEGTGWLVVSELVSPEEWIRRAEIHNRLVAKKPDEKLPRRAPPEKEF